MHPRSLGLVVECASDNDCEESVEAIGCVELKLVLNTQLELLVGESLDLSEERERIRALVRDTALLGVGHGSAEGFLISLLNFLEELVFVGAITKSRAVLQFLKDACKSLRGRGYAALGQARSELTLVRVCCAASSDRFVLRVLFDLLQPVR